MVRVSDSQRDRDDLRYTRVCALPKAPRTVGVPLWMLSPPGYWIGLTLQEDTTVWFALYGKAFARQYSSF